MTDDHQGKKVSQKSKRGTIAAAPSGFRIVRSVVADTLMTGAGLSNAPLNVIRAPMRVPRTEVAPRTAIRRPEPDRPDPALVSYRPAVVEKSAADDGAGPSTWLAEGAASEETRPRKEWMDSVPREVDTSKTERERQQRREAKFAMDSSTEPARFSPRRRPQHSSSYRDEDEEGFDRAELKRQRKRERAAQKLIPDPTPIAIPSFVSVGDLARLLKVRPEAFLRKLATLGFEEMHYDHILNAETAGLVAMEYNFAPVQDDMEMDDLQARPAPSDKTQLPARPPVVTIMGHVDHGKTTLLDYLRQSSVAASEAGGITQHIGAFSVPMSGGKVVTFLDTPGHAAFLSMRQRGAHVTDIVILVVAADDSVKPQTIEAIRHAQAAKVPMIVAVSKIDKEEANVERVKQDLARHGVEIEDFGGETQVVCVSGKTGAGMAELEEATVTLSEILDLRAETDGAVEGWVLEATKKSAGRMATVLVRRGTIRVGDLLVAGTSWARIRTLRNEAGQDVEVAGPGTPVAVDGWRKQPQAGDEVLQAADEAQAKSVVEHRIERAEQRQMATDMDAINETRRLEHEKRERDEAMKKGLAVDEVGSSTSGVQEVFFIIKGDVSGSIEAVVDSVSALGNSEVRPHVLRSGVGPVSEFDVEHAAAAKGHIISFNTAVDANMARLAEAEGVSILDHNIIYRLVDEVKAKLSERLPPNIIQRVTGEADVAQIFDINTKGRVRKPFAGCKVRNGVLQRTSKVRVVRDANVVYDGTFHSLKHIKKDVAETRKGGECGLGVEGWDEFQVGDQIQCYEEKIERRSL
ncbi:MAG: hypothetical protein M1838_002242 [Thelocarpon superellum]|nr:MAG: hypothetical protein M1838_002242 [Thelocarpon superellum]